MMKKVISIMLAVIAAMSISVDAQRAGEYNLSSDANDWNHSGIITELGAGVTSGDLDADLGLSLGLGYRYHFGNGINWDIVKVTYYVPCVTEDFGRSSSMRFLTGMRYNSAPMLVGLPLYATFGLGYQLNVSNTADNYYDWYGFSYEIGAGVNLSRLCSLGLMWEGNYNYGDKDHFGILGAKIGIHF